MQILVFRHAEKTFSMQGNPPLSEYGSQQATKLAQLVEQNKLPRPEILLCSLQLRTLQTLLPLSRLLQIEVQKTEQLDERKSSESLPQYREKIRTLIESFSAQKPAQQKNTFLVTHFDWLEEAMSIIPCDQDLTQAQFSGWSSACFMHFQVQSGIWTLQKFSGVDAC